MPRRLAIVEDHHALRQGLELLLDQEGRDVVGAVVVYAGDARGVALDEVSCAGLMEALDSVTDGGRWADPDQPAARRRPQLSPRERQVLQRLSQGLTNEQVAAELVLSVETVKTHVRNAIAKCGARNRVHAIAMALRSGEIGDGAEAAA